VANKQNARQPNHCLISLCPAANTIANILWRISCNRILSKT